MFLEERELGLRKVFFEDPGDEKDDRLILFSVVTRVLAKSGLQQQQQQTH